MKIIRTLFVLVIFLVLDSNNLNAASFVEKASGIKDASYKIIWCSPHVGEKIFIDVNNNDYINGSYEGYSKCLKGSFIKSGDTGVLGYKPNLNGEKVGINSEVFEGKTDSINLFDVSNLRIDGEGIYFIEISIIDKADNNYTYSLKYVIDKTAPQFELKGFNDNSDFVYSPSSDDINNIDSKRISGIDQKVKKYDSNTASSSGSSYTNPLMDFYTGLSPIERDNHIREDLHVLYYKNNNSTNTEFYIESLIEDHYDNFLKNDLISNIDRIKVVDINDNVISTTSNVTETSTSFGTNTSIFNNSENSQKKVKIRVYDKAGNFSESAFYLVRDNTKPNMGGNGLASNEDEALYKLLKFDNTTTVFDKSSTNHKFSKFITANDSVVLKSDFSDIGIKNGDTNYKKYNSGVKFDNKLSVEDKDNELSSIDYNLNYDNRFINNNSNVDPINFYNSDIGRTYGSRKYTSISSICDRVGNCLEPNLDFRVVADKIDFNKSLFTLKSDLKVFADGDGKYTVKTDLKDKYGNAIVGVKAVNNGGKIIKKVQNTFNFTNKLYIDQINKTGQKGVNFTDNETDNSIFNNPESDTSILIKENSDGTGNGTYNFSISSIVPTSGIYDYLNSASKLVLNSINPKSEEGNISGVGIYPNKDDGLGLFDNTTNISGSNNFISYSTGFLNNSSYKTDIDESESNNYGKISLTDNENKSFNTLTNKKLEFEFAAPFVYSGINFTVNHLINNIGQWKEHEKKTYTFGNEVTNTGITEQFLPSYTADGEEKKYTPGIFNIYVNDSSNYIHTNSGTIDNINNDYSIKSEPIKSDYKVAGNTLNMGYVSYLTYKIDGKTIKIPSISRNISKGNLYPTIPSDIIRDRGSDDFFEDTYTIVEDLIINTGISGAMSIALTGLSHGIDTMIKDATTGTRANVDLSSGLTKSNIIGRLKKNIKINSAGLEWCKNITSSIGISELNNSSGNSLKNCTIKIQGETISFIEGDIDIECGGVGGVCRLNNNLKRTIIVKDGSTYIKSNITTYNRNSQLLIGTIADKGLKNITIGTGKNPYITRNKKTNGWLFIDPEVTNIDAYLINQGPVVSYEYNTPTSKGKLFNSPDSDQLNNQLHIFGSLLSLNTVGGYKVGSESVCPYIINGTCSSEDAFIFDLVTLRRFSLEGSDPDDNTKINNSNGGLRSGKNDGILNFDNTNKKVTSGDSYNNNYLRYISDTEYIIYPLFIEKDTRWNKNPSVLFKY